MASKATKAKKGTQRKLTAILCADVVGYSRLMGDDEEATIETLTTCRKVFVSEIESHNGRVVDAKGDAILAEFASVVDAVNSAVEIQRELAEKNTDLSDDRRMDFRIGINLGDVVVKDDVIYGDGVNVAARLEALAEPGGICISRPVYDQVKSKLKLEFEYMGEQQVKNITEPVRAYRVGVGAADSSGAGADSPGPSVAQAAPADGSRPRPLPASRQNQKPFVVVTEFDSRSEDEMLLAKDLRGDLATALARLTGLEVTVDQGKADYLIHGSIRFAGHRCRLSAQLISADDEKQLWADRYDENTNDPFEILDLCVPRITMSIRRRIASDHAARLSGRNLDDMTLEQLLSVAGVSFFTPTKDGWLQGGKIAEFALKRDPTNFMALAMAAAGYGMAEYLYGFRQPDQAVVETAFEWIEEGRRQTNRSDMLLCVYSCMLLFARKRHKEAAAAAERALQLNPEFNMGLWSLGAAQIFGGNYADGTESATRAVNVDIRDPYVHLYSRTTAYGYFGAEAYQEAADWFFKADQLAPGLPHNLAGLAASQWQNGDHEGAQGTVARLLDEEPEFRVRDMIVLPFQDSAVWDGFVDALRAAGAPK